MYVNIGLGNEGWWCLQGLGRSSRPYMEISNDDGRHVRFFSKGLTCDFGSKFQIFSKCVYGQIGPGNDVWECFRVVTQWSWPYMKTLCTPSLGSSHHCGTMIGFLVPPSRCYEGITLRLDSAKRYQKPFRGSHQGTTLTRCGQDWVWHTRLLSLALPKGWLPQLVFYPRREFSRGQFELFLLF